MEKVKLKYILYVVAAIFSVLVFYELTKSKGQKVDFSTTPVGQKSMPEKKTAKKKTEVFRVKPVKADISGPLHGFFEVVERSYKIVDRKLYVEIKRLKDGFPNPWKQGMELGYADGRFELGFYIEVLDADGDIVGKAETSIIYDRNALETITNLNIGEAASVMFDVRSDSPVSFRMGSSFIVHEIQQTAEQPKNDDWKKSESQHDVTQKRSSLPVIADNNGDEDEYEEGELVEEEQSDDVVTDEESSLGERSTWQKVKDKSKKIYRKSKEYTKNTYRKAKQKVLEWLNE